MGRFQNISWRDHMAINFMRCLIGHIRLQLKIEDGERMNDKSTIRGKRELGDAVKREGSREKDRKRERERERDSVKNIIYL